MGLDASLFSFGKPVLLPQLRVQIERHGSRGLSSHMGFSRKILKMAEGVGFEPTVPCGTAVFKTAALNQTRPPLRMGSFVVSFTYSKASPKINQLIYFSREFLIFFKNSIASLEIRGNLSLLNQTF